MLFIDRAIKTNEILRYACGNISSRLIIFYIFLFFFLIISTDKVVC